MYQEIWIINDPKDPPLNINLKKGFQTLNGQHMISWDGENNDGTGYPEGDNGRIKLNKVLKELIKQTKPQKCYKNRVYRNIQIM